MLPAQAPIQESLCWQSYVCSAECRGTGRLHLCICLCQGAEGRKVASTQTIITVTVKAQHAVCCRSVT